MSADTEAPGPVDVVQGALERLGMPSALARKTAMAVVTALVDAGFQSVRGRTPTSGVCPECGARWERAVTRGRPRTYCSRACQIAALRKRGMTLV